MIGGKVNEIIDILNGEVISVPASDVSVVQMPPNASMRDKEIVKHVLTVATEEIRQDVVKLTEALEAAGVKDFQVEKIQVQ